jgi:hypothetical protein
MKPDIETDSTTTSSSSCLQNIIDHHLPLRLLRSDIVTPAPTFSNSTIDFLPHFAGYSWIAYGASSILTITHFPSPLSSHQTRIGPIFRQFFELSDHHSHPVSSVSWSPQIPSSGYLAASAQNCIWVFHHDSLASKECSACTTYKSGDHQMDRIRGWNYFWWKGGSFLEKE